MAKTHTHPETALALDQVGSTFPPYQPTHDFSGELLSAMHTRLANAPSQQQILMRLREPGRFRRALSLRLRDGAVDTRNLLRFGATVPGWLMHADALKLYEMAWFSDGDILELGCYHGLSTMIMAQAVRDRGSASRIFSVDLDPGSLAATLRTLRTHNLADRATLYCSDAAQAVHDFARQQSRFAFAFVDHSHRYEHVLPVCQALPSALAPGAFVLFHDYNNPHNRDDKQIHYQVYQAVNDGLDRDRFSFCGIYGCTALYQFSA
jgi:predicted O-methyltransferase YrrM